MCCPQPRLGANTSFQPIYWAPVQPPSISTRYYGALLGDAPQSLSCHPPAARLRRMYRFQLVAHWSSAL